MLNKLRELERLLAPDQNDYLVALRERVYPIRGKASLGEDSHHSLGENYEFKDACGGGQMYGAANLGDSSWSPMGGDHFGSTMTNRGDGPGIEYEWPSGDGYGGIEDFISMPEYGPLSLF